MFRYRHQMRKSFGVSATGSVRRSGNTARWTVWRSRKGWPLRGPEATAGPLPPHVSSDRSRPACRTGGLLPGHPGTERSSSDRGRRRSARGGVAVHCLLEALDSKDEEHQQEAARVIGSLAPPFLEAKILDMAGSPKTRRFALLGLRRLNTTRARKALADVVLGTPGYSYEKEQAIKYLSE